MHNSLKWRSSSSTGTAGERGFRTKVGITYTKKPLVSVIIPCYNGEKFIGEAIESVLNQTYQNFEIIIVDDGSTDGSRSVIKPFLNDPRIKLVEHGQNRGIPAARNTGIKMSKGEFIAFLDQDDLWLPEKLERQIAVFEHSPPDVGLVFSNINTINSKGIVKEYLSERHVPLHINELSQQEVLKALFLHNFIPMITVLVRRACFDTVGLLDESLRGGSDDYDFCLRLAAKYKIKYLNIPLALHRIHGANYSNAERFFRDDVRIMDKILSQLPFLAPLKKKKLAILYYGLGRCYQLRGDFRHARLALWKAIQYHPLSLKPFLALLLSLLGHWGNRLFRVYRAARGGTGGNGSI